MKNGYIVLFLTLLPGTAYGDDKSVDCQSVVDCWRLADEATARIKAFEVDALSKRNARFRVNRYGDYVVDASYDKAQEYCADRGMRLPSLREMAELAAEFGAKIIETRYPGVSINAPDVVSEIREMKKRGFTALHRYINPSDSEKEKADRWEDHPKNADLAVDFYYSGAAFRRPLGDLGNYHFWASPAPRPQYTTRWAESGAPRLVVHEWHPVSHPVQWDRFRGQLAVEGVSKKVVKPFTWGILCFPAK